jgi:hypothetical protein
MDRSPGEEIIPAFRDSSFPLLQRLAQDPSSRQPIKAK